ncbi:MAG: hypothetical protein ACW98W_20285 [Candidatus Hodarchaeales archaeon]|jgi:hypothetical protein
MRNRDDIEISEIGVNAFNNVIGAFNWGNDNRYTAANIMAWGIDCYNSGVNIPLNYDGASKPRLSGRSPLSQQDELEMNQYYGRIDDIINELANDYSSVSDNQLLQIFYYFNVPKSSSYEYQLYFNDDYVSSDINDVIRYGVFSLARDLIELGYERRDDGEA